MDIHVVYIQILVNQWKCHIEVSIQFCVISRFAPFSSLGKGEKVWKDCTPLLSNVGFCKLFTRTSSLHCSICYSRQTIRCRKSQLCVLFVCLFFHLGQHGTEDGWSSTIQNSGNFSTIENKYQQKYICSYALLKQWVGYKWQEKCNCNCFIYYSVLMKFSSMHIFFVLLYTPLIEMFAFGGKCLLCTLTQAALSPGLNEVRWPFVYVWLQV